MTGRRVKSVVLAAGLVVSGSTILAWSQTWLQIVLTGSQAVEDGLEVAGDVASGSLAALGLAGLALVGALTIAGPVFRVILGVLEVAIGSVVVLSSVLALARPVEAAASAITDATGVSGIDSISRLVTSVDPTPWPWFAVVVGTGTIALGIVIVATRRSWPGPTRRYQSVGWARESEPGLPVGPSDQVSDWDSLSEGSDPTSG